MSQGVQDTTRQAVHRSTGEERTYVLEPRLRTFRQLSLTEAWVAWLWRNFGKPWFSYGLWWWPRGRVWVLRCYGAKVHGRAWISPWIKLDFPWNLRVEAEVVIDAHGVFECTSEIHLERGVHLARKVYCCTGTHEYTDKTMPIRGQAIRIGAYSCVMEHAFVGPGVRIGEHVVVEARSSVFKDLPSRVRAAGTPARVVATSDCCEPAGAGR